MRLFQALGVAALIAGSAASARADDHCSVPMAQWQPRSAVILMAEGHGWTVRRIKIDDGCYEVHALDENGTDVEFLVHPETLEILQYDHERDRHRHRGDHERRERDHD